jgi:hypothetical protein
MALSDLFASTGFVDLFPSSGMLITIVVAVILVVIWFLIFMHKQKRPTFKQEHKSRKKERKNQKKEEDVEKKEEKEEIEEQIDEKKEKEELEDVAVELPKMHDLTNYLLKLVTNTMILIQQYLKDKNPEHVKNIKLDLGEVADKIKDLHDYSKKLSSSFKGILDDVSDELSHIVKVSEGLDKEKDLMKKEVLRLQAYKGKNMDVSEKVTVLRQKFVLTNKIITLQTKMKEVAQVEVKEAKVVAEKYHDLKEKSNELEGEIGQERKEWQDYIDFLEKVKPFAKESEDFWDPSNDFYNNSSLRMKELSKMRVEIEEMQREKERLDKLYDSLEIKELEKELEEKKKEEPQQMNLPF